MNYTITTTLWQASYDFLQQEAKRRKTTKKNILEESLKIYEKIIMAEQIREWLAERYWEYKELSTDFSNVQFNSIISK